MVLIICTENESFLTNTILRYGSGQTKSVDGRTDGRNGRTQDAKTISLRLRRGIKTEQGTQKYYKSIKFKEIIC